MRGVSESCELTLFGQKCLHGRATSTIDVQGPSGPVAFTPDSWCSIRVTYPNRFSRNLEVPVRPTSMSFNASASPAGLGLRIRLEPFVCP